MKLTGKKLILLLIYSPTNTNKTNIPIQARTRIMKMGFLFEKELLDDFKKSSSIEEIKLPEFFPWKYGPFSTTFLNDLEFLINQKYVCVEQGKETPIPAELAEYEYWIDNPEDNIVEEYNSESFSLTEDRGYPKAKEFWQELDSNQKELIIQFKTILCKASVDRIIDYVYKKYEKDGYIDKSLIRERYLG